MGGGYVRGLMTGGGAYVLGDIMSDILKFGALTTFSLDYSC